LSRDVHQNHIMAESTVPCITSRSDRYQDNGIDNRSVTPDEEVKMPAREGAQGERDGDGDQQGAREGTQRDENEDEMEVADNRDATRRRQRAMEKLISANFSKLKQRFQIARTHALLNEKSFFRLFSYQTHLFSIHKSIFKDRQIDR